LSYVEQVRKAAITLRKSPQKPVPPNAAAYVRTQLEILFTDARLGERRRTDAFYSVLRNFISACNALIASVENSGGFEEGDAWRTLVRKTARSFEEHGLRAKASKDNYRRPSPFVAFVQSLQDTFPPDLRRHHHSDSTLSKAVSDALRNPKRDVRKPKKLNESPVGTLAEE
jgi:hypothetical protein